MPEGAHAHIELYVMSGNALMPVLQLLHVTPDVALPSVLTTCYWIL